MAPDKIYTDNRGVYAELPVFSQADANVAYIRKDALLEWAKENNKMIDTTEDGDYSLGYLSAMIDLIEKIESL